MTADNNSKDTEENAVDNNQTNSAAEQQREPVRGPGEILQKAREEKNLSQRDVADRLRLRLQIIELLEEDDYESFSTPTFIKGYLRAYAKVLGVDDQEVFAAYRKLGIQEPDTTAMQSFSRRVKHQENDNRLMLITYAVIIVVISLVIWWWQDSDISFDDVSDDVQQAVQERQPPTDLNADEQMPSASEPSDTQEPVLESEAQASQTNTGLGENNSQTSQQSSQPVTVSGTEQPETVLEAVNEPSPAATGGDSETLDSEQQPQTVTDDTQTSSELSEVNEPAPVNTAPAEDDTSTETQATSDDDTMALVFEFSEECWVKVDDATGETQAVGIKAAGYTMPVPGDAPFAVTICKPEAVTITYQGENVDLSSFRQARVARFTVPLSN